MREKSSLCMFSSLLSMTWLLNGWMSPEKNYLGEKFVWKDPIQEVRFAGQTEGIICVSKFHFSGSLGISWASDFSTLENGSRNTYTCCVQSHSLKKKKMKWGWYIGKMPDWYKWEIQDIHLQNRYAKGAGSWSFSTEWKTHWPSFVLVFVRRDLVPTVSSQLTSWLKRYHYHVLDFPIANKILKLE